MPREAGLPSNATLETYLVRDRGFSEPGAQTLMAEYKDTIAFAKLGQPDTIPHVDHNNPDSDPAKSEVSVGDFVQIEIGGVLQLSKATQVRAVREDQGRKWVFIEGSETGVPMEQVTVEQKGPGSAKGDAKPPVLALTDVPSAKGARKEVFALDEGDVVLTFPENLSAASFQDLEDYFRLFLNKARRRAGVPEPTPKEPKN